MSENVSNQGSQEPTESPCTQIDPSNGGDENCVKEEPRESLSQLNQASQDDKEIKTESMEVDPSNGGDENSVKDDPRESLSQLNQVSDDDKEIKPEIKTESMQVDLSSNGGVTNEDVKQEPRESISQMNQVSDDKEIKLLAIKTESTQPQTINGGDAVNKGGVVHAENNIGCLTDLLVASIHGSAALGDHYGEDGSDEKNISDLERQILSNAVGSAGVSADNGAGGNGVVAADNGSTIVADGCRAVAGDHERRLAKGKRKCEGDDGVIVQANYVFKLLGFDVYTYEEDVGNNIGKRPFGGGATRTSGRSGSGGGSSFRGGTDGSVGGSSSGGGSASKGGAGEAGGSSGNGEHKC